MKFKVFAFLLLVCSFNLSAQYRALVIKDMDKLFKEVENISIKDNDRGLSPVTYTSVNFTEHPTKKGWVVLTTVRSRGSDYEDQTTTYSFDPDEIIKVSKNDEKDKERGNKAFLFALTFDGNKVEVIDEVNGKKTKEKVNMIVTHIKMKGSDGYEIMDELRELFDKLTRIR